MTLAFKYMTVQTTDTTKANKFSMKEEMEKMKDKKMKTMYNQNLELKQYVKSGTLYSARKTWELHA